MISFGNEELANAPSASVGQEIDCPHCGGKHTLFGSDDEVGEETPILLFYQCGDIHYLAAVNGKAVVLAGG